MLFGIGLLDHVGVAIGVLSVIFIAAIPVGILVHDLLSKLLPVHNSTHELEPGLQVFVESSVGHHLESVIIIRVGIGWRLQYLQLFG